MSVMMVASDKPPSDMSMHCVWASLEANPTAHASQTPNRLAALPPHGRQVVEAALGPVPGLQALQALPSLDTVVLEQGVQVSEY